MRWPRDPVVGQGHDDEDQENHVQHAKTLVRKAVEELPGGADVRLPFSPVFAALTTLHPSRTPD